MPIAGEGAVAGDRTGSTAQGTPCENRDYSAAATPNSEESSMDC
jgi:hypothetical protein